MARRLISCLSHIAVTTPCLDKSVSVYRDVLGLSVSGQKAGSVFLRAWGEHHFHSLKLVEGRRAGLACIGWRAAGPEELRIAVDRIEKTGRGKGWVDPDSGRGAAYQYVGPGGHLNEIFWEQTPFAADADETYLFPSRPERYVPRGCGVRELDHVTVNTPDIMADTTWFCETLGHRFMEYIADGERIVFAITTTGERGHDMGFLPDSPGNSGRVHHISYFLDQRVDLYRAADILLGLGIDIEFGPGRHGLGEQDFLYFREASGLRIELNAGGYRNAIPDWKPVRWEMKQGGNDYYKNREMPKSMYQSFPDDQIALGSFEQQFEKVKAFT